MDPSYDPFHSHLGVHSRHWYRHPVFSDVEVTPSVREILGVASSVFRLWPGKPAKLILLADYAAFQMGQARSQASTSEATRTSAAEVEWNDAVKSWFFNTKY